MSTREMHPHREPLAIEFERLSHARDSERLLARWRRAEPALATFGDLDDVPRALAPEARGDTKDQILLALIRRAQCGDARPASICILVSLWPKLRSMSGRIQPDGSVTLGLSRSDILCALQGAMFEEILRYRTTRWTRRVAATLALNTLHAVTDRRHRQVARRTEVPVDLDAWRRGTAVPSEADEPVDPALRRPLHVDWSHQGRGVPVSDLYGHSGRSAGPERDLPDGYAPTRDTEMVQTLAWAVREGAVNRRDAILLYDLYLGTDSYAVAVRTAAQAEGRSEAAIRQRCSRAVRAIAAAIRCAEDTGAAFDPAA